MKTLVRLVALLGLALGLIGAHVGYSAFSGGTLSMFWKTVVVRMN